MIKLILIGSLVVIFLLVLTSGYVKSPPDIAFIISGLGKKPKVLIGQAGIRIPFFERLDKLLVKQISVDIKTNGAIPTKDFIGVDIDAIAKVRIMTDPEGIQKAMKNFLNMSEERIIQSLTDSLQGNMREIIGTVSLKELCTDRKQFGDQIQEKAQADMNALGIEIISCNIQKIEDEKGLINALGQDNMSQIQKSASIAKAEAERDVKIAQAEADKAANEAEVNAKTEIAKRNNDLAIKESELKAISDNEKAKADAAYEIQKEEQRRSIETQKVNADIAKASKEAELKEQEIKVKQNTLAAEIKATADAEKYRKEKEAEAIKLVAMQEAEAIRVKGEAEAEAIRAKGKAEADAMLERAKAYQQYNKYAAIEKIVDILPQVAKEVSSPITQIKDIKIFDGGSDGNGVTQVGGYVPGVMAKTFETVKAATGIDLGEVVKGETYDAKVNKNIKIDSQLNSKTAERIYDKKAKAEKEMIEKEIKNQSEGDEE